MYRGRIFVGGIMQGSIQQMAIHGQNYRARIADLVRDAGLVGLAREVALQTVREDPRLRREPELARAVRARWGERLELAAIG